MKPTVTILEAVGDQKLFAGWFRKPSWSAWFAFLTALFALPMTPEQVATFQACTGRNEPPTAAAREAWLICGRRSGKSFILALCAVFLACFRQYRQFLQPGERASIMIVAADRRQARTIFRYVKGLLNGVPMLKRLIEAERSDSFDLSNSVSIEINASSFRSVRGYTLIAALLDEVAFWRSDDSANPDREVLSALRPAMATIPGAMLLCASSPYARRGILWDAFKRHHGQDGPVLVWKAPTRIMNPSVPQSVIDEAMERDPADAAAEFLAEFRSDVEQFVSREIVDAAVVIGRHALPRIDGVQYCCFIDPSGGSSDSMTMAISHCEGQRVILDLAIERRAPLNPDDTTREFAATIKAFGLASATGDRYAGAWVRQAFATHGIDYVASPLVKSEIYLNALPLLNANRIELLDNKRLVSQLCSLERRTARGGRDSIDHAPGSHDDVANAALGSAVMAARRAAQAVAFVPPILITASDPHGLGIGGDSTKRFYEWMNGGGMHWGPVPTNGNRWWGPI